MILDEIDKEQDVNKLKKMLDENKGRMVEISELIIAYETVFDAVEATSNIYTGHIKSFPEIVKGIVGLPKGEADYFFEPSFIRIRDLAHSFFEKQGGVNTLLNNKEINGEVKYWINLLSGSSSMFHSDTIKHYSEFYKYGLSFLMDKEVVNFFSKCDEGLSVITEVKKFIAFAFCYENGGINSVVNAKLAHKDCCEFKKRISESIKRLESKIELLKKEKEEKDKNDQEKSEIKTNFFNDEEIINND